MKTEREREREVPSPGNQNYGLKSMSYTYTCSIICAHFIYIISYHINVYINTVNVWFNMDMYVNTIICMCIYIYTIVSGFPICISVLNMYISTLHMVFLQITSGFQIASGPSAPQLHIPEELHGN